MGMRIVAVLIPLVAFASFLLAIRRPEQRSTFIWVGAILLILGTFAARAARQGPRKP